MRPPTIATPSGRRSSAPVPPPTARGMPARSAAKVVIRIGRSRSMQAWKIASRGGLPSMRSASSAKSIIMIAFFSTMPISRMIPISAITLKSIRQIISDRSAPTPAEGSVERIVTGWM